MDSTVCTQRITDDLRNRILQYYIDAGMDYAFWSSGFNMHFGFGDLSTAFNREKMLNRMSIEVLKRALNGKKFGHLADFGCGVGATMRTAASIHRRMHVTGLTIVPWQKQKGDILNEYVTNQLEIKVEDFHSSSLEGNSFDGVYAIESACYSPPSMQPDLFHEMHRVLKPGSKMVIADGFLKVRPESLGQSVASVYRAICRNWALPGMMNIEDAKRHLEKIGFRDIRAEEVSWRVAPSVMHVPFVILWFLLYKKFRREKLSKQSIRNLKGSIQTLLLGLQRNSFGYYFLSAQK